MKSRNRAEYVYTGTLVTSHNLQNGYDWTSPDARDKPYAYECYRGRRVALVVESNASPYILSFVKHSYHTLCEGTWFEDYVSLGLNRAYSKLIDTLNDGAQAELLTFIGEGREAMRMIARRALQMAKAYKQLRAGDLRGMFKTLGYNDPLKKHSRNRRPPRGTTETAGLFLETSYGWLPTIGDIISACEVLGSTPKMGSHMGKCTMRMTRKHNVPSGAPCPNDNVGHRHEISSRFRVGGKYGIVNHNSVLLNQLGFVNPVSTGWELVPFSFLVDQVLNVSQFISSWTDFYGRSRADEWYVDSHYVHTFHSRRACPYPGQFFSAFQHVQSRRRLGPYKPKLLFGGWFGLARSAMRCANNLALLVALFGDVGRQPRSS